MDEILTETPLEKTGGDLPEYIGKYEILGRLGTGGMAEVFLARRSGAAGFEKKVALKRLATHKLEDEVLIRSLINEARLVSQLSHQNLVQVLEFELIERAYCMVMEYVEGMTLETVLDHCANAGVYLPSGLVIYIALEVCAGLDYAHHATTEEGAPLHLVHRDIKPSNVMISRRGQVKLMDFGIAKATTNAYKTTAHGGVKGTLAYMSPEQLSGESDLGPASDLYSFGLILYELATLQRLYDDSNLFKLASSMQEGLNREARERLTACFPELVEIVSRLLNFYPDQRYPDARSLMYELRPLLFHSGALELAEFLKDLSNGQVGGSRDKTLASRESLYGKPPANAQSGVPEQAQKGRAGHAWQEPSDGFPVRSRGPSLPPPSRGSTEALPSEAILAFGSSVRLPANGNLQNLSSTPSEGAVNAAAAGNSLEIPRGISRGSESPADSLVPPKTAYSRRHLVASALTGGAVVVAILVWLGTRAPDPVPDPQVGTSALQVGAPATERAPEGVTSGAAPVAAVSSSGAAGVTETSASVPAAETGTAASGAEGAVSLVAKESSKGRGEAAATDTKGRPTRTPAPRDNSKKSSLPASNPAKVDETRPAETAAAPVVSTGTIRIASQPWAEVYVDGKKVGEVPYKAELPSGSHQVKLVTTDGVEKSFSVIVKPGEEARKGWSFKENQWLEF